MPRSRFRHHKQRWDPTAEFIFTRRMRVGDEEEPWAPAGSPVDKVKFARRLKTWWNVGLIEIKGWTPELGKKLLRAAQERRSGSRLPPPPPAPEPRRRSPHSSSKGA